MSETSKMVTLKIDGREVKCREGQTILEVCREQNLADIPSLCYDPRLPPYGSCYLCVVQVEGFSKLLPSCATPVREGMVVETDNQKIRQSRKMALELLLSNHYADCIAPCKIACPAGVDVQGYIALIAAGEPQKAVELIRKRNPLPLVCSRVCVRYCEVKGCRRGKVDEPVGINNLKRFAADFEMENHKSSTPPPFNGHKVAVIGGGPAGLSCAYYLRMMGYAVTIFEMLPKLGGMLRYGIPEYRLPRDVLDREIRFITTDIGIDVKTGKALGKDFTISSLKKEGFEAIFLAIGALDSKKMGVDGEMETPGVERGLNFLMGQELEGHKKLKGRVVVVGGGNTAIDVARTSLRLGASEVIILYRRTRNEMPADPLEVHDAEVEGVKIEFLAAPVGIERDSSGKLKGLKCIRMELGEPDSSGRRRPVPIKGSEYFLECDLVFSAIGQESSLECLKDDNSNKVETTKWKTIVADEQTLVTNVSGVFAGGDVVKGPDVVIGAIAHGRMAALSIDEYIRTGKVERRKDEFISKKDYYGIHEKELENIKKLPRQKIKELPPEERVKTFDEVSLGLDLQSVELEALRCLECGCQVVLTCKLRQYAEEYSVQIDRFRGEVRRQKIDDRHPFIRIDNNKCILCARCIRLCSDLLGITALGFVSRGFRTEVHPALNKPLQETNCVSCGNCVDVCPTGAIKSKFPFMKKILPVETESVETTCNQCSVGCKMNVQIAGAHTFWISGENDECNNGTSQNKEGGVNGGLLCFKGRYNFGYMIDSATGYERVKVPFVRRGNNLEKASWEEAIKSAHEGLMSIVSKYGRESIAVFGSPSRTNEEIYLLQKYARLSLGTNNICSYSWLFDGGARKVMEESLGFVASTATLKDVENADVILLIGDEIPAENFIAGLFAKRAASKGAKIIKIGRLKTVLDRWANIILHPVDGGIGEIIDAIAQKVLSAGLENRNFINSYSEGFEDWKEVLKSKNAGRESDFYKIKEVAESIGREGSKVVALINIDSSDSDKSKSLSSLVNLLILTGKVDGKGSGIVLLENDGNGQGARDMGLLPEFLPGHCGISDTVGCDFISSIWGKKLLLKGARNIEEFIDILERSNNIKGLILLGENPLIDSKFEKVFKGKEFLVVIDEKMTESVKLADVVLPLCSIVETDGTMTNTERRVQQVSKAFAPICGKEGWQVLSDLIAISGCGVRMENASDVWNEICKIVPVLGNATTKLVERREFLWSFGKDADSGLYGRNFKTDSGKVKFICSEKSDKILHRVIPVTEHRRALNALLDLYLNMKKN